MTGERGDLRFWLIGAAIFVGLLVLLGGVLLPFVAGMAVAYLLDPPVERLARRGLSRTAGTLIVLGLFFVIAVGLVLMLVPLLHSQIAAFAGRVPGYVERAKAAIGPLWEFVVSQVSDEDLRRLPELAGSHAGQALQYALKFAAGLISGGAAVANLLSLLFITPLVAFYLLRDWPKLVGAIDLWLPRAQADTIRQQLVAIDATLAGFVRGQAMVCFALAAFYALGLGLTGLDFGLVVGIFAGLISFVPFIGTLVGGGLALALGLAQFGVTAKLGMIAAVFVVGQVLEGNVLTPKLVGDRVGLHPVWVIFALLAGGALFGFLGVLLAVPAAAVIGVLARFALKRYLASPIYRGRGEGT
jgi:predicted PurR-regulated permease PerM